LRPDGAQSLAFPKSLAARIFSAHETLADDPAMTPNDISGSGLSPGGRFHHYEVLRRLGTGGVAEVFHVRDTRDGRELAIKALLQRAVGNNPNALSRFHREVGLLASLSHPNILHIYEHGSHEGVTYAAVELLEGESLAELLRHSSLSWQGAAGIGIQVANGLACCHAAGVIHRDLKPSNVFLTRQGTAKILDFGMAALMEAANPELFDVPSFRTGAGVMVGTGSFMSPELLCGLDIDARADLFSLGAMLYEMITGAAPFRRGSPIATMAAVLRDVPASFEERGVVAPARLEALVNRCLAKDPRSRYESASQVSEELCSIVVQC
jgi:serine/threonine protein kinase